jgi:hypothetical protein
VVAEEAEWHVVEYNPIIGTVPLFAIPAFKRHGEPPRETRASAAPRNDAGGYSDKVNLTAEDTPLAFFKLFFDEAVYKVLVESTLAYVCQQGAGAPTGKYAGT